MLKGIIVALALAGAMPAFAQATTANKPLEVEVLRTSAGSLHSNIALIKGEKKAVLVDAPFTLADSHRVVAMVLDSGKELETIFITHDHPDHFFGMEVLTQAFPNAKVVAHPQVVADIWKSLPLKVKRWGPVLGTNGPKTPTAPSPLEGDTILLEGRELKVIGPMQGDHVHATVLWVPSIRAVVAGDLLFNDMHLWLGEQDAAEIAAWGRSLDQIVALKPELVVAGHAAEGLPNDDSAITFTKGYIDYWPVAVKASKNSANMQARIKARYPKAQDVLGDFLLGNSSRVAMGEQPKWVE